MRFPRTDRPDVGEPVIDIPRQRGSEIRTSWQLPILMYHSVTHSSPETALPYSVSMYRLEEQLLALVEAGWELVGLSEALTLLDGDPSRQVAALTFDDGLLDFLNAVDVMRAIGARSTLYVPSALVGNRVASWEKGHSTLAWSELKGLSAEGVEIGSHSVNHRPLDVHGDATVEAEVRDSRRVLEDRLGVPVTSFSYPHGYTSGKVGRAVERAGYDNACIVGRRIARSTDNRFTIPRVEARPGVTGGDMQELVRVGERGLTPAAKRTAMPAWRLARRTAFTVLHRELT
jgi:peptidoglycan/xylan/chitin deacetylase (PgdA/CDA1 family)